ncbi:MAG: Holliday junction branch migration protein RuvA [Bacteroidales bacterium]|mgnify:FL=1|jgi:Holliday junction DNA helicase RuvA|nr:Holliday junction branch migration protein RuvA [Bacteroidales bacterium]MDD4236107.1 Holliday junction branch migration protein RuvA [Bacteroidales bacterium]MDY0160425.1 Holliday junction branch migration protein RuvA [Bacteroidales bacterium]
MFEFITGYISELNPTYVVLENNGIGYIIQVSLNTSSKLKVHTECQIFIHEIIREDARFLYGFFDKAERELFRLLISVNGVGANTARIILSGLSAEELSHAIMTDNVGLLKTIKGIGAKTAQRIIIDLRDKIGVVGVADNNNFVVQNNTLHEDALQALTMLGFNKQVVDKVLRRILKNINADTTVEQVVKSALKEL